MPSSDIITVTNGEHDIKVTEKAYVTFYRDAGYAPAGKSETLAEPTNAELKAALDDAGVEYPKGANKAALLVLFATIPKGDEPKEPEE